MNVKTRIDKDSNYKAIYFNGKTLRIALDHNKPIMDLEYPEFLDVKITNKCDGGCPYCYMDSDNKDKHYDLDLFFKYLMSLNSNQKPFQIAYGGGEVTEHPKFEEVMKMTKDLDIQPNYTTNGMWSCRKEQVDHVIDVTKKYCGGVAVSCHKNLESYWRRAVNIYTENDVFTNLHIMISDKASIDYFMDIYLIYKGRIKYFVLLPLIEQGRCKNTKNEFDYLFDKIKEIKDISDIAFGAKFYDRLQKEKGLDVSLYEPEIMSKFIDLKDGAIYKSSFDTGSNPIKYIYK